MVTRFDTRDGQVQPVDSAFPKGFVTKGVRAGTFEDSFENGRNRSAPFNRAGQSSLPVYETHLGFKYIGESLDEDKTVPRNKDSARLSFKSHYSKEDGVVACLFAAEATPPSGPELS